MRQRSASAEQFREHNGVVVLLVASGVENRDRTTAGLVAQLIDVARVLAQLFSVAIAELAEPLWVVAKPPPQIVARRKLPCPFIETRTIT